VKACQERGWRGSQGGGRSSKHETSGAESFAPQEGECWAVRGSGSKPGATGHRGHAGEYTKRTAHDTHSLQAPPESRGADERGPRWAASLAEPKEMGRLRGLLHARASEPSYDEDAAGLGDRWGVLWGCGGARRQRGDRERCIDV